MTTKGELVNSRPLKQPRCAERVKYICLNNVPEHQREKKFKNDFHKLSSLSEQRQFFVKHVTVLPTSRKVTKAVESRRAFTKTPFSVVPFTTKNGKFEVCREFFLDTLNISESLVRGALKKVISSGILLPDLRGEKEPPNKVKTDKFIREHILSFPKMESNYARKKNLNTSI